MRWLQDPNQSSMDNLNNVRNEDSRHQEQQEGISES
jgi:hypothetical protein